MDFYQRTLSMSPSATSQKICCLGGVLKSRAERELRMLMAVEDVEAERLRARQTVEQTAPLHRVVRVRIAGNGLAVQASDGQTASFGEHLVHRLANVRVARWLQRTKLNLVV